MKNNQNYFIIHGSFSNPQSNWFGWLADYLRSRVGDLNVYTPDFPIGVGFQNYKNWSELLNFYLKLGLINKNTTIIAHSIAPVFVSKFLVQNKVKVKKLIFVCGFNNFFSSSSLNEYDEVNKSMYFDELPKIKNFADEIVCFYSDNDPYVDIETEATFAKSVATKTILLSGAGHINAESGFLTFDEIKKYL